MPPMEEILTILPPPWLAKCFAAACRDILKIIKKGVIHISMINKEIGDFKSYAFHEKEFKMVSKEDIL